MSKQALVIGATGDVGRGITTELLKAGWRVIAAGRSAARLQALRDEFKNLGALEFVEGSVQDAASARALQQAAQQQAAGPLDAVITSVNGTFEGVRMDSVDAAVMLQVYQANVIPHVMAAQAFIPTLGAGAAYIAIGGGMADLVFPGRGPLSACQAAQRMVFRYLADEMKDRGVRIHELMLYAMIAGQSNRATADPRQITDEEVGRHVVAVLAQPGLFAEPILTLKSKKQVGQPAAA